MSYGVYVVGTMDGERPTGCIANSVMQITASPATVAVSMNHDNYSQQCIEKAVFFSFQFWRRIQNRLLSEHSDFIPAGILTSFRIFRMK